MHSAAEAGWLVVLGLAFSSSLDNFGAGVAYGVRRIRIAPLCNLLIAAIAWVLSLSGAFFGRWIAGLVPDGLPSTLGAILLLGIGLRFILQAFRPGRADARFGPTAGGFGHSGSIKTGEAILLGIALSADALTNGLGAGLLRLSPLAVASTAGIGSFIAVWWGGALGRKAADLRVGSFPVSQIGAFLSGMILAVISCHALIHALRGLTSTRGGP